VKFYKVLALPTSLHGSKSWTIKARNINKTQTIAMRYLRTVKGWTRLDNIKNEDIRSEPKAQSVQNKTDQHTKMD
jgi:hypothetical protein